MEHSSNNFWSPELIFFLKSLDPQLLPGHKAHLELTPYRASLSQGGPQVPPGARKGAVAVIVSLYDREPVLLLTKRVDYKGVHGGQVSFPGGRWEEGDTDLLQTALRETYEETGLVLDRSECILVLSGIYIPPSNFHVQPYLFVTSKKFELNINHEVDYPILARTTLLFGSESLQKTRIRLSEGMTIEDAPCFVYGQEIIWGATAAILNELRWIIGTFTGTKAP